MTVDEIFNDPLIQEARKKYTFPSETFTSNINTPEREKLRHDIADQINTRGSISGKNEFNGKVNKEFRAEIVIGAPVGGKSSVIVDKASKDTGSRVLDSDEIKALLPEFDGGNGAGKVHTESADEILSGMVIPEYYKGGTHKGENNKDRENHRSIAMSDIRFSCLCKNLSYTGGGKNGVYKICKKTEKIPCILWKIAKNLPKIPDFLPYSILKI